MMSLTAIAWAAQEAAAHNPASPAAAIGLDWRALLFQVVNFAILLFLLRRFAYKPLLAVLEERRKKVEESLRAAEQIEEMRVRLERGQRAALAQAQEKADAIVAQGRDAARRLITEGEAKTQVRTEQMIAKARGQIEQEVQGIKADLRKQTLHLVAVATERILQEKLDPRKDEALVEQALAQAQKAIQKAK